MKLGLIYYYVRYYIRVKLPGLWSVLRCRYVKRTFEADQERVGDIIKNLIESGKPFMAGRIGANESFSMRTFEFENKKNYQKAIKQLHECAGFFPEEASSGKKFLGVMKDALTESDVCGVLQCPVEECFINKYTKKDCVTTILWNLECLKSEAPWSALLRGKKVLVVHPFSETIKSQYQKRELLFPGRGVLPEFQLITYKAIQTAAGEVDDRFGTWFDALQFMTDEISKIDFDIALLGCGAYGFPLAANIKRMGKQAIHIGGGLQLFFGIKGKRWDEMPTISYLYNDAWVYPNESETPKGCMTVENACYWK